MSNRNIKNIAEDIRAAWEEHIHENTKDGWISESLLDIISETITNEYPELMVDDGDGDNQAKIDELKDMFYNAINIGSLTPTVNYSKLEEYE